MLADPIRISSLPTLLACPSSRLPTQHPYDPPSAMATLGTAAHEALATVPVGGVADTEAIAQKYGVELDELERLYHYGCAAWHELGLDPEHCRTEIPLHGTGIRGTADVVYHDGVQAIVVDWKSNRVKRTYRAQLVGYAAALTHEFVPPESGEVKIVLVWLRFGELEVATVTDAEVQGLYRDIDEAKTHVGQRYGPGHACTYCQRQLICEARHEYLASATAALLTLPHVEPAPELIPQLYHKAKALRKALEHYDQALRLMLADGALDDGQGHMIQLRHLRRESLVPEKAWSLLLEAGLTDEDMARCVRMSKTKIMQAVGRDLKRGEKGKARAEVYHRLKDGGAIVESVSETVAITDKEN